MSKNFFSNQWKEWFSFSRRERNGILILLVIIFIEAGVLFYLHYFPSAPGAPADFSEFIKQADAFEASLDKGDVVKDAAAPGAKKKENKIILFAFEPNTISEADLKKLGLSNGLVKTIVNYRSKGGKFKIKSDLMKVYGMNEILYAGLKPFILLPDELSKEGSENAIEKTTYKSIRDKIDIGTADTIQLNYVHGIGYSFARRIFKYREKLGGFTSMFQLKEVYGMTDSLFDNILPQITLNDPGNTRRIDLNTADYELLRNHPYIGSNLARILVNYRMQHGLFSSVEDLHKIPLFTDELYSKLAPYLKAE